VGPPTRARVARTGVREFGYTLPGHCGALFGLINRWSTAAVERVGRALAGTLASLVMAGGAFQAADRRAGDGCFGSDRAAKAMEALLLFVQTRAGVAHVVRTEPAPYDAARDRQLTSEASCPGRRGRDPKGGRNSRSWWPGHSAREGPACSPLLRFGSDRLAHSFNDRQLAASSRCDRLTWQKVEGDEAVRTGR